MRKEAVYKIFSNIPTLHAKRITLRPMHSIANPWLIWLLPVAGVVIVFLYRFCGKSDGLSTDLVLLAVRSKDRIPLRMAPLIFVSTLITHLFGGSAGREGAALQLGGSIAQSAGRLLKLDEKDMHIITMCGMSAYSFL